MAACPEAGLRPRVSGRVTTSHCPQAGPQLATRQGSDPMWAPLPVSFKLLGTVSDVGLEAAAWFAVGVLGSKPEPPSCILGYGFPFPSIPVIPARFRWHSSWGLRPLLPAMRALSPSGCSQGCLLMTESSERQQQPCLRRAAPISEWAPEFPHLALPALWAVLRPLHLQCPAWNTHLPLSSCSACLR